MARWIIGSGWEAECDVVDAPSQADAVAKAVERSLAMGLSVEDAGDPDLSWAVPYDDQKAAELGLRYEPEVSGVGRAMELGEIRRTPWR